MRRMVRFEEILEGARSIAVAGHIRPDGDTVGACLGLMHYIKDNFPKAEVDVYLERPSEKFSILEGFDAIQQTDGQGHAYDLFVAVDCADLGRLGDAARYFELAAKTVCVDHHVSNQGFAGQDIIVADSSSTCEILCSMMEPEKISKAAAAALYMGIAHDTGVFRYSCTSPDTMRLAAMLMEKGIPYTEILEETFYKKTYLQNQVLGKALLESMRLLDGRCIVSVVRRREMDFFGVDGMDLEGIVSQLKLTEGVEAAIFMYEIGNHEYKVSLRSGEKVDVSRIATYFGGGGHMRAAGLTMQGTYHDIVNNLALHIEHQLQGQGTK